MKTISTLVLAALSTWVYGQQQVKNFSLPGISGDQVSLENYSSVAGIAVIFTGNDCAFDNYYTSRVKSIVETYSGKIQFLLINAYLEPGESVEKMTAKYKGWGFKVPYLADKDQTAMNIFGAKKSPEAFLLKNENGKFFVVYQGAFDDNPQVESDVKQPYLKTSIDQLLAGKKIEVPVIRAAGCNIRRK